MDRKQLARLAKNWKIEFQKALAWSCKENDQEVHAILEKIQTEFLAMCEKLEKYSGDQGEFFGSETFSSENNPDEIHAVLDTIIEKISNTKIKKS